MVSRFKWGLTADIQQPDFETRIAIIRKKLQADGILISDPVIEYLAYSVNTNIRELEGVIISMIAHASLTNVEVDLELAKTILKNIVSHIDSEVGVDYIQKTVGEYFNISIDDMKAKTRKKEVVIARLYEPFIKIHRLSFWRSRSQYGDLCLTVRKRYD